MKTALLLAYMKGNGGLCRALVKSGTVVLGNLNNAGVSIFNCAVASKVVFLFVLLEQVRWGRGET